MGGMLSWLRPADRRRAVHRQTDFMHVAKASRPASPFSLDRNYQLWASRLPAESRTRTDGHMSWCRRHADVTPPAYKSANNEMKMRSPEVEESEKEERRARARDGKDSRSGVWNDGRRERNVSRSYIVQETKS